jgi:hypothetical protein
MRDSDSSKNVSINSPKKAKMGGRGQGWGYRRDIVLGAE